MMLDEIKEAMLELLRESFEALIKWRCPNLYIDEGQEDNILETDYKNFYSIDRKPNHNNIVIRCRRPEVAKPKPLYLYEYETNKHHSYFHDYAFKISCTPNFNGLHVDIDYGQVGHPIGTYEYANPDICEIVTNIVGNYYTQYYPEHIIKPEPAVLTVRYRIKAYLEIEWNAKEDDIWMPEVAKLTRPLMNFCRQGVTDIWLPAEYHIDREEELLNIIMLESLGF